MDLAQNFAFDPLDEATRRRPFPLYDRARREFPVYEHSGLPVLSVFRYADAVEILKDADIWSSNFARVIQPYLFEHPELAEEMPPFFATSDGDYHRRLRSLVNKAFTPRIVRALVPAMRAAVNDLLDKALEQGEVDLVPALTAPFPIWVIAQLLGVPAEDAPKFQQWSRELAQSQMQGVLSLPGPELVERHIAATRAMHAYFRTLVEERRAEPREDLTSALVAVQSNGAQMTFPELLQMLTVLLLAGNASTTALISNMVVELLAHPDQLARLREDPGLVPTAVDEVLRFASPVQAMPRLAAKPTELHGRRVEPGQFVLVWIGSANRDETVFEEPDEFDVGRAYNPHIAFGIGAHSCIGSHLATLEGCVVLSAMLARTRSFELTNDAPLPLHSSFVARSYARLPMRLTPA
jgi:cytochrome P450